MYILRTLSRVKAAAAVMLLMSVVARADTIDFHTPQRVADIERAGIADSKDPRVVIPLLAMKLRKPEPSTRARGEGARSAGEGRIHGATLSVVNRPESHLIANGSRLEIVRLRKLGYD